MMEGFVLRNVNILDESGGFIGPVDVAVRQGQVETVGRSLSVPDLGSVDFSDLWLLPGVFDCHGHVGLSSIDMAELLQTPITYWALEAAYNARRVLRAGVTFVRDAGGADAGIRDAIAGGIARGPRMQISTVLITQTGGHGDGFLRGPGLDATSGYLFPDYPGRPPYLVDGPDAMRHAVRSVLRAGADWVKLATTGGVMSPTDEPEVAELTPDEIGVAVFEARRKGRHVMAHANGGEGLDNAVRAGVRSIEHGIFLTEEQAAEMAAEGCWLVPTLAIIHDVISWAENGRLGEVSTRKALALKPHLGTAVAIAKAYEVKIALGTDFISRDQHGRNLAEITYLCQAGLALEEALLVATRSSAELCGVGQTHGRLAPGFSFDAVVLDEEPRDAAIFLEPSVAQGVFLGGEPCLAHPRFEHELGVVAPSLLENDLSELVPRRIPDRN
jgi:imidazolonepropionase-like amidohydrolase